jgi:hypothetical protein
VTYEDYSRQLLLDLEAEIRSQYPNEPFHVSFEDPRYPRVVFNNERGYWWDLDNNKLGSQFCLCNAFEPSECICGVWDDYQD